VQRKNRPLGIAILITLCLTAIDLYFFFNRHNDAETVIFDLPGTLLCVLDIILVLIFLSREF
jgi:hypothetical protein